MSQEMARKMQMYRQRQEEQRRLRRQQEQDEKKIARQRREQNTNEVSKRKRAQPPNEFCDPITYDLMREPMLVTTSGHTYEKYTILECIEQHGKDPLTNMPITTNQIVPNRALKSAIERW